MGFVSAAIRFNALLVLCLLVGCETDVPPRTTDGAADSLVLRIATYNIEDVRTLDVKNAEHPRLKKAAAVIQRLRPDILLI
ncbi:MAG: endonuclease/exonuclease/phosphatase family protein, partial [Rhodothermales bacterium]